MEDDDVEDDDVKGEADDHVEKDDVEEEEEEKEEEKDDDFEEDNVEEEDRSQNRDPSEPAQSKNGLGRFTRALLNQKNTGKMLRTNCGPRPRHTTHVVRACAVEIHLEILRAT